MNPTTFPAIPPDTAKAARAVFGSSNFYLATGDQANRLFDGIIFENPSGQFYKKSSELARLYLITIFQFRETLPDNLAADALRLRIEWKYALHLPLNHPGLEATSLCEFRRWLLAEPTGQHSLITLLSRLPEISDLFGRLGASMNAVQVINYVCLISRLSDIWVALNRALEAVALRRPDWLLVTSLPHWYERYSQHQKHLNLKVDTLEMYTLAQAIGADGVYLLDAIAKSSNPDLKNMNEVLALREVWREQFESREGEIIWRKEVCSGCSLPISGFKSIHRAH